jgi:hypothetical protein
VGVRELGLQVKLEFLVIVDLLASQLDDVRISASTDHRSREQRFQNGVDFGAGVVYFLYFLVLVRVHYHYERSIIMSCEEDCGSKCVVEHSRTCMVFVHRIICT